jgi:hypothetical protein
MKSNQTEQIQDRKCYCPSRNKDRFHAILVLIFACALALSIPNFVVLDPTKQNKSRIENVTVQAEIRIDFMQFWSLFLLE